MTKELKEAIERCKKIITEKFNLDYSIDNVDKEAIETILNYIENSIPKEKVEKTFEYIEDYVERLNGPDEDIEYIKNKKQELLEGK